MKTLRSISTAVLVFFVLAVPAASASTISLTISQPNPTLGTPVSYTVVGEAEVKETYEVRIMHVGLPSVNCVAARPAESTQVHKAEFEGVGTNVISLSHSETIPTADYSALGTYAVCVTVRGGTSSGGNSEETASFTVVAAPAPEPKSEPTSPAVAPTPIVTPSVVPAVVAHVTPLTSAQKLHTALAKCKKQKNKKKRAKCERAAKTAAHR